MMRYFQIILWIAAALGYALFVKHWKDAGNSGALGMLFIGFVVFGNLWTPWKKKAKNP